MRRGLGLAAIFVAAAVWSTAEAEVVSFEGFPGFTSLVSEGVRASYGGYDWGFGLTAGAAQRSMTDERWGWYVTTAAADNNPAPHGITGDAFAWNGNGPQSLWIDFRAPTDVLSVDLAFATSRPDTPLNAAAVRLFAYDAFDNLLFQTSAFPLTDTFQWVPIAYPGRASSVGVSGTNFRRPMGQSMPPPVGGVSSSSPGAKAPVYGPCTRMDFELELGLFIGQGNAMGEPIHLAEAEARMFGICLLNDWSARDIQFWEMAPLGPFLGKNFCTSISPWIVTMEALAPYRLPFTRPADEPQPLAYLDSEANRAQGCLDIQLAVDIETAQNRAHKQVATIVSQTSFRHQYWTFAQMVTQHTMGGCNLQSGDLLGSGTISGPTPEQAGAIIELTKGGKEPITLNTGETRSFLLDGDAVTLRGWCEKPGFVRIGFGENRGEVLPAQPPPPEST